MPLDAPVTIATLLNSLFTIVLDPTPVPPNVHRCELRLARMKISIHAPYTKSGSPAPSAWLAVGFLATFPLLGQRPPPPPRWGLHRPRPPPAPTSGGARSRCHRIR